MTADFSCRVPHMKFGDFRNGRTTALGHKRSKTDVRFPAGLLIILAPCANFRGVAPSGPIAVIAKSRQ